LSEGEKKLIETFHYEINIDDADEYLRFKQIREQEEKEKKRKKRRSIITLSIVALAIVIVFFFVPLDATGKTFASSIILSLGSIFNRKGD